MAISSFFLLLLALVALSSDLAESRSLNLLKKNPLPHIGQARDIIDCGINYECNDCSVSEINTNNVTFYYNL